MGVWKDVTDGFDFAEETLEYVDTPIAGEMILRETGERFNFDCVMIVKDLLWHWTLTPSTQVLPREGLAKIARENTISILEDRRQGFPCVTPVRFSRQEDFVDQKAPTE